MASPARNLVFAAEEPALATCKGMNQADIKNRRASYERGALPSSPAILHRQRAPDEQDLLFRFIVATLRRKEDKPVQEKEEDEIMA
jgi:hypothetical protein